MQQETAGLNVFVLGIVGWPLKEVRLELIFFLQKPSSIYVNDAVLMLISRNLHEMQ